MSEEEILEARLKLAIPSPGMTGNDSFGVTDTGVFSDDGPPGEEPLSPEPDVAELLSSFDDHMPWSAADDLRQIA